MGLPILGTVKSFVGECAQRKGRFPTSFGPLGYGLGEFSR